MSALGKEEILYYIHSNGLKLSPFFKENVRENGIDLTLDGQVALLRNDCVFDFLKKDNEECFERDEFDEQILLPPHRNVLLLTQERIELNAPLIGLVGIKSTIARAGLLVPPTVIDYGFKGKVVIEAMTPSFPIRIYKGMPFVHLILFKLEGGSEPYVGHYQNQSELVGPKTPLKLFLK